MDDPDLTLLVLVGDKDPARAIHTVAMRNVVEEWRKTILLTDVSLLTAAEAKAWRLGNQRFVALGVAEGDGDAAEHLVRVAADSGSSAELLRAGGDPSILRIRQAFARADSPEEGR